MKQIKDAGKIEEIDWTKWRPEDCKYTDLPVPVEFEGKFARTIDNFLTEEECKGIIASCEKQGFEEALINMGGGM